MSFSSSAVTVEGRRYSAILAFVVVAVVVVVQELKCRTPLRNRIKTLNDDKTPLPTQKTFHNQTTTRRSL
jgi:hypothetical protein